MKGSLKIPFRYHFAKKSIYYYNSFTADLEKNNRIPKEDKIEIQNRADTNIFNYILYKELWCFKYKSFIDHYRILEHNRLNELFYFQDIKINKDRIKSTYENYAILNFSREILSSLTENNYYEEINIDRNTISNKNNPIIIELHEFLDEYKRLSSNDFSINRLKMFNYLEYFLLKLSNEENKYSKYDKQITLKCHLFNYFLEPEKYQESNE